MPMTSEAYWWMLVGMASPIGLVAVSVPEVSRRTGIGQETVKAELDGVISAMLARGRMIKIVGHVGPDGEELYKMMLPNKEWQDVSV